jgi:flavin reductase (DIM6/NTAB) family NADH-FMN oxidoreductase RutF
MTAASPARTAEIPAAAFRDAMARFATCVTVVTAGPGGRPVGCTATSVFSVSATPPSIGVSLNTGSRTLLGILAAGTFAVNVLSWRQRSLSAQFATGQPEHRFAGVPTVQRYGAPVLTEAASSVVCRVLDTFPLLDHTLLLGEVLLTSDAAGEQPFVTYRRESHRVPGGHL